MTISTTTLKNAAFAIECDLWTDSDGANYLAKDGAILRRWEPAASSADAFELMVRLDIRIVDDHSSVVIASWYAGYGFGHCEKSDDILQDHRAAILMCAASIGESIKCQ